MNNRRLKCKKCNNKSLFQIILNLQGCKLRFSLFYTTQRYFQILFENNSIFLPINLHNYIDFNLNSVDIQTVI